MGAPVDIAVFNVEGDLDVRSVPAARRRLDALVAQGTRRIFMNMGDVSYVDSAGMGFILGELRRIRRMGGLLSLSNVSPQLYRALSLMRIVEFMPVSRAGERREVAALDPSVLPRWRTTFRVGPDELSAARERLGELLSRLPLTGDALFDMGLACGEALGNAVDHTCADGVLATVAAYPDRVCVEVSDCGCGFELADGDESPEAAPEGERGRGIRLMRLLADSVSITRKRTGEGTVVRLVKLLDSPGSSPEGAPPLAG